MLPPPPPGLLGDDAALFLDFDGTLVELAETPEAIVVDPALPGLLRTLAAALDGRLAIVSGRPVDEIVTHLGLDPAAPGIAIAGSHGVERLAADGMRHCPEPPPSVAQATVALEAAAGDRAGPIVERKPYGVALHYRRAPHEEAWCEALAVAAAERHGLHLQRGKMVFELRVPGIDKGDAVRALAATMPRGTRPVFVGDDLTDEAGFAAAGALGGAGILVGERTPSAATHGLVDVTAVIGWLGAETKRRMNDWSGTP